MNKIVTWKATNQCNISIKITVKIQSIKYSGAKKKMLDKLALYPNSLKRSSHIFYIFLLYETASTAVDGKQLPFAPVRYSVG